MSEPVEGQTPVTPAPEAPAQPAPVAQPVAPQVDPAIAAFFESKMNERISGLQSGYQNQINELARQKAELEYQLKTASMSEEEREQQATADAEAYVESLEQQVALSKLAEQYPRVAQHVSKIYGSSSAEEIAQYLDSLLNPQAPEAAAQVPPVDPNNPPAVAPSAAAGTFMAPDGQSFSKEMRQQILNDASSGGRSMFDLLRGR